MQRKLSVFVLLAAFVVAPISASGDIVVNVAEVGGDVVFSGSGSIDLTGLTLDLEAAAPASVDPDDFFLLGPAAPTAFDSYTGAGNGPANIGFGTSFTAATSGSGDLFGVDFAEPLFAVPDGYVSGDDLSASSTYSGHSFDSLGITTGTYTWTLGSNNFTLNVVPEPTSFVLLSIAGMAVLARRRRK